AILSPPPPVVPDADASAEVHLMPPAHRAAARCSMAPQEGREGGPGACRTPAGHGPTTFSTVLFPEPACESSGPGCPSVVRCTYVRRSKRFRMAGHKAFPFPRSLN